MAIGFRHVSARYGQLALFSPRANADPCAKEAQIVHQPFAGTIISPDEWPMHLQEPQGHNNRDPWACSMEL